MSARSITISLALAACGLSDPGALAQPYLVKDINTAPGGLFSSAPAGPFAELNGRMFFFTRFGLHSSDGTPAGTSLIVSGCSHTTPASIGTVGMYAAVLGPRIIFNGPNNVLWSSDGTAPGTVPLLSSTGTEVIFRGDSFSVSGSSAYFLGASNSTDAPALWQTDGTPAGTFGGAPFPPIGYTPVRKLVTGGGQVYAVARNSSLQYSLFRADTSGTPATQVAQLWNGSLTHTPDLIATTDSIYFTGNSAAQPTLTYVWRIPFSTGQILPTNVPVISPQGGYYTAFLGTVGASALLVQYTTTYIYQLWSVSPDGATRLSNTLGSQYPVFSDAVVNGSFFSSWQWELCRSDGTSSGTVHAYLSSSPAQLTRVGNECWFSNAGADGFNGQWFAWDVSSAAPRQLVTLPGTSSNGLPSGFPVAAVGNHLFFNFAPDNPTGIELWVTDGTPSGTLQLEDLGHSTLDSTLGWFISWSNLAFFTNSPFTTLWVTDGTADGTHVVLTSTGSTVTVNRLASTPNCLLIDTGSQLVRSDGTSAGTFAIGPHPTSGYPFSYPERHPPFAVTPSGIAYFGANDTTDFYQLWRTDGTVAGTYKVTTRAAGFTFDSLAEFCPLGQSSAVFRASTSSTNDLWTTDGTPAGTHRIPLAASTFMERPIKFGNLCIFAGNGLRRTDGTLAGTFQLTPNNTNGAYVGAAAGSHFFVVDLDASVARATDGTFAGTFVIPGVAPTAVGHVGSLGLFNSAAGVFASNGSIAPAVLLSTTPAVLRAHTFIDAPDATYYFGSDGYVWKTDGTPAGTVHADPLTTLDGEAIILNTAGAPNNDAPAEFDMALAGSRMVFHAASPTYGRELWALNPRIPADCNTNGLADLYELAGNTALDANHNNVIDSCECLADWSGQGLSVQDILDFLTDWFNAAADFNHSGATTIDDIFDFLNAWFAGC
jgi:ELWxxDGT repeat protein